MTIITDNQSQISVIIPVHNGAQTLSRCLEGLRTQTRPPKEIILIDDASSDSTQDIAKQFGIFIHTIKKQPSAAQVRREGFVKSSGQIVVNIDSDVVIPQDALEQIELFMNSNRHIGAITGVLDIGSVETGFFTRYKHLYMNYIFTHLFGEESDHQAPAFHQARLV